MQKDQFLRVHGGFRLEGEVFASGGKNAALAVLPAALLTDEPCVIENLPMIDDMFVMRDIFLALGAKVEFSKNAMRIEAKGLRTHAVPELLAHKLRASYYFLGALLGRVNESVVPFPGGCAIGSRLMDQHIKGFEALGARVYEDSEGISIEGDGLRGSVIYLDIPSVGATINIMLAAALAKGNTEIVNAGKEPHIVDLANFLNAMGASVRGAGTDTIRIKGVPRLHGCNYAVIPDQIETGTLMIAAAATGGDVLIRGALPTHMEALTAKLLEMGVRVDDTGTGEDSIRVRSEGRLRRVNIKTQPYPGFPTDLQQPMSALLSAAEGVSVIQETIFESRFRHLEELRRMGGKFTVKDRIAVIEGVKLLTGCPVLATDLRAGAALVIAGLMAQGVTEVNNIHYIDRGYEFIERKLNALGAKIERLERIGPLEIAAGG
ncbi:MAG: UDP-N-acetylglucosamine 1-carboxyvinyltransferase [Christensenellaceae bacterium]|nr:UDP-N-acetylglucosamine 1-carboxyvinyltransferase [Christensenellaceae bacterium]